VLKLKKGIDFPSRICAKVKLYFQRSTLESFFWNHQVLLCGSPGADVTAESVSSWTTRPLYGYKNKITANHNNNNYQQEATYVSPDTGYHYYELKWYPNVPTHISVK
jgi:hypothetical protein